MKIAEVLKSGRVRRWHANPDMIDKTPENLAEHQWAVAMIVMFLDPNATAATIRYALTHDVGEKDVGDLPSDFKRQNSHIAMRHKQIEDVNRKVRVGNSDADADVPLVSMADSLAAHWFVACHAPGLARRRDWQDHLNRMRASKYLTEKVNELISHIVEVRDDPHR